jgi:hypothetical protein
MTQTFRVQATVRVIYEYEVVGDTIEEVAEFIEDGEMEDECFEVDSSLPVVTSCTIQGQAGWNAWPPVKENDNA